MLCAHDTRHTAHCDENKAKYLHKLRTAQTRIRRLAQFLRFGFTPKFRSVCAHFFAHIFHMVGKAIEINCCTVWPLKRVRQQTRSRLSRIHSDATRKFISTIANHKTPNKIVTKRKRIEARVYERRAVAKAKIWIWIVLNYLYCFANGDAKPAHG